MSAGQLIYKDTGIITLFAFDEGQELSEHTTPFDAFVHVIYGAAEVTISGKSLNLVEGETVIMPANQPHVVEGDKKIQDNGGNDKIMIIKTTMRTKEVICYGG